MRVQPRWWIGGIVYLAYMGWMTAVWLYYGLEYSSVGTKENLQKGIIFPLGIAAIALILFNILTGWWSCTTREPRARHPIFLIVLLLPMLGFMGFYWHDTSWASIDSAHMLYLVTAMLLVGFCEEMVARGVLLVGLRGTFKSEVLVWFWSSALFGLMHAMNAFFGLGAAALIQIVLAFCAGTGFYLLRRLTGNLWVPVIFHALWDFSSIAHDLGKSPASISPFIFLGATYLASISIVFLVFRRDRSIPGKNPL